MTEHSSKILIKMFFDHLIETTKKSTPKTKKDFKNFALIKDFFVLFLYYRILSRECFVFMS